MKIALNRSSLGFWMLYFALQFSFLLIVLFIFRWLWFSMNGNPEMPDWAELAFESASYALLISIAKYIRYRIGKARYAKNPVDRRRNNLFRE